MFLTSNMDAAKRKASDVAEWASKKFENVCVFIGAGVARTFPQIALLYLLGAIPKAWIRFLCGLKPFAYATGIIFFGGLIGIL